METDNTKTDLAAAVLGQIEGEHIAPHSRLFFVAKEAGVWSLWLMTVIFGALAIAVTTAVGAYRYATGYELTHESFFGYAAEVLPSLWIFVFGAMTFLAVYNLRHTKRGYRYSVMVILGSSLLGSLTGGLALHLVGFGFTLDHLLGTYVPSYQSQDKVELRLWQRPEQGRLVGIPDMSVVLPDGSIRFKDVKNGEWSLVVEELPARDAELVAAGGQVRLIGEVVSLTPPVFRVCGVLPWLKERFEERREMAHLREELRERMNNQYFMEPSDDDEAAEEESSLMVRHCAQVSGVRRLRGEVPPAPQLAPSY